MRCMGTWAAHEFDELAPKERRSGGLVQGMTSNRKSDSDAARTSRKRAPRAVDDPIQQAIGEHLKAVFDEVVQQPVPERFTLLLQQLEEQERQKK